MADRAGLGAVGGDLWRQRVGRGGGGPLRGALAPAVAVPGGRQAAATPGILAEAGGGDPPLVAPASSGRDRAGRGLLRGGAGRAGLGRRRRAAAPARPVPGAGAGGARVLRAR